MLNKYSERGEDYVYALHTIMRVNKLAPADGAYLDDSEAMYLVPVVVLALIANKSYAEDWSFQLEPYFLGTTITGDAGVGRVMGATRVDFESGSRGTLNYFAYDTVTHGPLFGVIFNF